MTRFSQPLLPGRLSNPDMVLVSDPRIDPRIAEIMKKFGMGAQPASAPVNMDSPISEIHAFCAEMEIGLESLLAGLLNDSTPADDLERRCEVIRCAGLQPNRGGYAPCG